MRNTSGPRSSWGTYVKTAREHRRLTQTALARLLDVDRATIYRWETKQQRPESAQTVAAVAGVLGLDLDEALAVAGLRPDPSVPLPPVEPYDEELELVRTDSHLDPEMKVRIVDLIMDRRAKERADGLADTRKLIALMRRQAG